MKTYKEWKEQIIEELKKDDQAYFEFEYGTYDETFDMSDLNARAIYLLDTRPELFPME